MAYFSNNTQKDNDSSAPFKFNIDEQGRSTISIERVAAEAKQRDNNQGMLNVGKHCEHKYCGQLDVLPTQCDFCHMTLCKVHLHAENHECKNYVADLHNSPYCEQCHDYIKIPVEIVTTREQYDNIIKLHKDSNCTQFTFKRTKEEKAQLRQALQCSALNCNNHTSSGKKLSTLICKACSEQVCLSHRFPQDHQCVSLPRGERKEVSASAAYIDKLKQKAFSGGAGRLGGDIRAINDAKDKCRNPILAQKVLSSKQQPQQPSVTTETSVVKTFSPINCISIPSRGTLIVHDAVTILNVKTAILQAKPKTKNPSLPNIPQDRRVYTVVYFPQTVVPSTTPCHTPPVTPTASPQPPDIIPFSSQPQLVHLHSQQTSPNNDDKVHSNELIVSNAFIPQCGPISLQNNKTLHVPLFVCMDTNWTIKECINEIAKIIQLPQYDLFIRSTSGQILYTLSMLSLPHAILINSMTLGDIIACYQHDFDQETLHYTNTQQHEVNKAVLRKNTVFLPLHLAFGWYIDVNK